MLDIINPDNFKSLSSQLQKYVDDNLTGGISCLVYHKDKLVFCNKYGWKDKEKRLPVEFDTIFRIYSMTKPVVCLALLTLYEEGKFQLDDPISNYIPEFADAKVLKSYDGETGVIKTEDLDEPITIRHLFTHTAGLTYGLIPSIPAEKLYLKKFNWMNQTFLEAFWRWPSMNELSEWIPKFAKVPLVFQPGKHWWYSHGHDVIGYLIEKLSGIKLDEFLKERFFDKLGMQDTDFYVTEHKWHRLAKGFTPNETGQLIQLDGPIDDIYRQKPKFLSGGTGLVSTLNDYLKFTLMMLQGGTYNGTRYVSKETIDLMTQNHLQDNKSTLEMNYVPLQDPELIKRSEGYGFGLGIRVKIAENITSEGIGTHAWGGAMNTIYWIDPKNQLITILMTQCCPPDFTFQFNVDEILIRKLVYDSIQGLS